MDRRTFNRLAGAAAIAAIANGGDLRAQSPTEVVLEDKELLVALDKMPSQSLPTTPSNVNWVLSWRLRRDASGDDDLLVDFRTGWIFDSAQWIGRDEAREKMLAALVTNTVGKPATGSSARGAWTANCSDGTDARAAHDCCRFRTEITSAQRGKTCFPTSGAGGKIRREIGPRSCHERRPACPARVHSHGNG